MTSPNARGRHVVVRTIDRTPLEVVDQLAPIGTASVHEAIGKRGYLGADITPIQEGVRIAGNAVTVLVHPSDNIMIHAAVELCTEGDILVVATTAPNHPSPHGIFGDLLATSLQVHGVRGLVIDTGVRDTHDLRTMGFPVWSRYVSCQGPIKANPGSVNVPVTIGGAIINPGDVICADDDGVVVVARTEADWALEQSKARLAKEATTRQRLADGELGVDVYGLRPQLADLGVEYLD
jgi:4-hydroxy-4-methyl-2-oxoglutarate aldolase